MLTKTHQTAVVLIPPDSSWGPIQEIRRVHDRQVRRWMPHVTLIYPFRPRAQFEALAGRLRDACASIGAFEVSLADFRHFQHRGENYTLWLAPEPAEPLIRLQRALQSVVPDCDDTSQRPQGFTPHLSVGQIRGQENMAALKMKLQGGWRPLSFMAFQVSLIWRSQPPDDVFRVDRAILLGQRPPS